MTDHKPAILASIAAKDSAYQLEQYWSGVMAAYRRDPEIIQAKERKRRELLKGRAA